MLPDFTEAKTRIRSNLNARLESEIRRRAGPFAQARHVRVYEGDLSALGFSGEDPIPRPYLEAEAELSMKRSDIPLPPEEFTKLIEDFADRMAEATFRPLYQRLAEQIPNQVDMGGRPLTPEAILKGYEIVELSFNEDGTPDLPTMVVPPALAQAAEEAFRKLHEDPDLSQRLDDLVARKREEWRAREASRKLVD